MMWLLEQVCRSCGTGRRRLACWTVLVLSAAFLNPSWAVAQDALPQLEIESRLRLEPVSDQPHSTVGRVVLSTPDSLGIARRNDMLFFSRAELRRVQTSAGRNAADGALEGAGWGALVVGGLIVLGAVGDSKTTEAQWFSATSAAVASGIVIIPVSALLGAIIGSERWTTVWERK